LEPSEKFLNFYNLGLPELKNVSKHIHSSGMYIAKNAQCARVVVATCSILHRFRFDFHYGYHYLSLTYNACDWLTHGAIKHGAPNKTHPAGSCFPNASGCRSGSQTRISLCALLLTTMKL
jgi:hypothetical protein